MNASWPPSVSARSRHHPAKYSSARSHFFRLPAAPRNVSCFFLCPISHNYEHAQRTKHPCVKYCLSLSTPLCLLSISRPNDSCYPTLICPHNLPISTLSQLLFLLCLSYHCSSTRAIHSHCPIVRLLPSYSRRAIILLVHLNPTPASHFVYFCFPIRNPGSPPHICLRSSFCDIALVLVSSEMFTLRRWLYRAPSATCNAFLDCDAPLGGVNVPSPSGTLADAHHTWTLWGDLRRVRE